MQKTCNLPPAQKIPTKKTLAVRICPVGALIFTRGFALAFNAASLFTCSFSSTSINTHQSSPAQRPARDVVAEPAKVLDESATFKPPQRMAAGEWPTATASPAQPAGNQTCCTHCAKTLHCLPAASFGFGRPKLLQSRYNFAASTLPVLQRVCKRMYDPHSLPDALSCRQFASVRQLLGTCFCLSILQGRLAAAAPSQTCQKWSTVRGWLSTRPRLLQTVCAPSWCLSVKAATRVARNRLERCCAASAAAAPDQSHQVWQRRRLCHQASAGWRIFHMLPDSADALAGQFPKLIKKLHRPGKRRHECGLIAGASDVHSCCRPW